jgi:hypothetical protein
MPKQPSHRSAHSLELLWQIVSSQHSIMPLLRVLFLVVRNGRAWSLRNGNGGQIRINLHPLFPDGWRLFPPAG